MRPGMSPTRGAKRLCDVFLRHGRDAGQLDAAEEAVAEAIEPHQRTGRPLAAAEWLAEKKAGISRKLARRRPVPDARVPDGPRYVYCPPNFGLPAATNTGAFQYTGQVWLPELGVYHYKARMYAPTLGRFLQTDPVGYGDGMNMYAYVGNDPVNGVDPLGLQCVTMENADGTVVVVPCTGQDGKFYPGAGGRRDIGDPPSQPWLNNFALPPCVPGAGCDEVAAMLAKLNAVEPQNEQDRCSGGRATFGLGGGLTFFLGDRGFTFNLEIGIAHGTSAGSGQLYVRGSVAGLGGGGAYGGAGGNASGGVTSAPLSTGYTNDKILAAGAAYVGGVEVLGSTGSSHGGAISDPSLTASVRGGYGGYIAAGDRHTVTAVLIGGC